MKNVILKEVMRRLNEEAGAPLKHPVRRVVINPACGDCGDCGACGACGACGKAEIVRTTNAARIIVSQDRLDAILADIRAECWPVSRPDSVINRR